MSVEKNKEQGKKRSSVKTWLIRFFLFLLFLPVLLSILFQFSFFQNFIAGKATNYLSEKMGTKVTLSKVDISIFDGLVLKDFLMMDSTQKDTIIYTGQLSVGLNKSIFSLFSNALKINTIALNDAKVNMVVDPKSRKSDLETYLSRVFSSNNTGKSNPLNLDIKNIHLKQIAFSLIDAGNGQNIKALLDEGKIKINTLNLKSRIFVIDQINFIHPDISLMQYDGSSPVVKSQSINKVSTPFCLTILKTKITEGHLSNGKTGEAIIYDHFDGSNFDLDEIELEVNNLNYGGLHDLYASIENLSAKLGKGAFVLDQFRIPSFSITNEAISADNFMVKTGKSSIGDQLDLTYDDFINFKNAIHTGYLTTSLEETQIAIEEVAYFLPEIKKTAFYKKYGGETLQIDGQLNGRLENIKGNGISLQLGPHLNFDGNFGLRNIQNPDEALINLNVTSLSSNVRFIADIVPGFNPPQNFYSLGKFNFSGFFDGYLNNFATQGKLSTEIGNADLGIELNVKEGSDQALYKGDIALTDFDLFKWSGGNKNLGKISLKARIRDGKSLVLKNASADLDATIQAFDFKGYHYQNIQINGQVAPQKFEGTLLSDDPNLNLNFEGKVEFNEQRNKYDFKSKIVNVDLRKLNLSKDFSGISGDIEFDGEGKNINDLIGVFKGNGIRLMKKDTLYEFDSLIVRSSFIDNQGNKKIDLLTEDVKIKMEGKYDFGSLIADVSHMVKKNFAYHLRNWNLKEHQITPNQAFTYEIQIDKGGQWLSLAGLKNMDINDFKAKGYINTKTDEISITSSLPALSIENNNFHQISLLLTSKMNTGDLFLKVDSSFVSNKKLRQVDIHLTINGDNIDFDIKAPEIIDSIQNFELNGRLVPHPKGYTIAVTDNNIKLFGKRWKISNDSKISLGSKYIDLENVVITDGSRMIQFEDINNKGVYLALNQIDINSLNPLINYDKIQFGGIINSAISVNDIFNPSPKIDGNISIPTLLLNGDSYGEVAIDLTKAENSPLDILISISNSVNGQAIKISGKYDFNEKTVAADFKARKMPLKFLHYILKKGVSRVDGYVDLNADISGKLPDIKINGRGKAFGGAVRVIYLGETYYFDNQNFGITDKRIDMAGAVIRDSEGNTGVISGGLNHTLFKDFYLDASISGENVIAVNTTKFDNPIYYGLGKGNIVADFSGSVNTPKMVINAVTTKGTNISIPIKETRTNSEKSFITFIDKDEFFKQQKDSTSKASEVKIEGMTIELNLTMTEDAKVNLIFDELKNDIIRGIGNGNLRITMTPAGEFTMFGNYTITSGEYLFTAFDFVNKPFIVREGGTIKWTGDPVNASLNIEADYKVRTTLSSFIAEYLVTENLKRAAAVSTQVNLKLILGNTLYSPSVKFDLEFPELTGEMKSYTDSKLRLLRNNDAEYNNQVFGLIVFNAFLPSNTLTEAVGNNFIQNAGISTLSEFVSSQLSLFVTGLVNEALEENGLISGVDFDIALRNTTSFQGVNGSTSLLPSEIEVRLKNKFRFLDERLSINIGGNYVRENTLITGLDNYVIPEFFVEYALTKDRQLNLKLYGKYDLDEISVTNRRQKFGLGLRYKNEFGSLVETKSDLRQGLRKIISNETEEKKTNQ